MLRPIPASDTSTRIKNSPNFRNGVFHNESPTPVILEGVSFFSMLRDFFNKPRSCNPSKAIPVRKSNLELPFAEKPIIIWFGHSSYLIRFRDKNFLIDPVFSGRASPVPFFIHAFEGSNYYQTEHMPQIDWLIITHNHYDHADKGSVPKLRNKVKNVLLPLGVGKLLEDWGYERKQITEFDWWEYKELSDDIRISAAPARHFTGRGRKRNETLWCSFALQLGKYRIYLGGDSGYDSHFKRIGKELGPFDLAILENGQYGKNWPYIHMMPEELADAAIDLNAKAVLPVHWGKFALSNHPWTEPVERLLKSASERSVKVSTPMVGEALILDESLPESQWWKQYE